jgi:trans-2,3-dihydro-3-hydroxyanthranilate isomerase
MTNRFFIVDVFAESAYSGNQLAVVVCEVPLPDATMQQIAAETNYSETTFVTPKPEQNGGYRVRIFTPAREIAFAGHPILGSAWVLRHHVLPRSAASIRLNLALQQIPVEFEQPAEGDRVGLVSCTSGYARAQLCRGANGLCSWNISRGHRCGVSCATDLFREPRP